MVGEPLSYDEIYLDLYPNFLTVQLVPGCGAEDAAPQ
jgi:hypothetical protein